MASIANDETDVVSLGKLDGGDNVVAGRDIRCVAYIVAQQTWPAHRSKWITALVRKVSLHNRRRGIEAIHGSVCSHKKLDQG